MFPKDGTLVPKHDGDTPVVFIQLNTVHLTDAIN